MDAGGPSSLQLDVIFRHLQQSFVPLITSMPELLEPYQSVNSDGATVRRYAIINPDNQVQINTHLASNAPNIAAQPAGKSHQQKQLRTTTSPGSAVSQTDASSDNTNSTANAVSTASSSVSQGELHDRNHSSATASASSSALAELPASIRSAVTYMQRRFGSSLSIQVSDAKDARSPDEASAAHDVCTFQLTLQPTDPAWDAKQLQNLRLQGRMSGQYPQQGCYSLQLHEQQQHISESASSVVNQLIAGEARQHVGRPGALQQLLRFIDNRAGMLFHEAEDIVLEASRMRRQSHAQNQVSAGVQAPPPPLATTSDVAASSAAADSDSRAKEAPSSRHSLAHSSAEHQPDRPGASSSIIHRDGRDVGVLGLADEFCNAQLVSDDDEQETSEREGTDGSWSDSHWDSSASYTGHEQPGSESDYHHESSDTEGTPEAGDHAVHTAVHHVMQCSLICIGYLGWVRFNLASALPLLAQAAKVSAMMTLEADLWAASAGSTAAAANNNGGPDRNALQLQLQDLMLDNVDALEALKLNIQVLFACCPSH